MSGRFVRASKFRHIFADVPKRDNTFSGIKPMTNGESNFAYASKNFVAVGKNGGGGPYYLFKQDSPARIDNSFPDVNVHKSKCLDISFNPFNETLVASASDDGYAKVVQIPEDGLTENIREAAVTLAGHQKKVMWAEFNPVAANTLLTGSFDHTVKIWDIEAQAECLSYDDHPDLIQSVLWNGDGSQVASTCKDKQIRMFDMRALDTVQTIPGYEGGKSARVMWADNMNKLFVTGFSKTSIRLLRAYDPRNFAEVHSEFEFDQSAGVMIPHYDPDLKILYVAGKGDGMITYFEINDNDEFNANTCIHRLDAFRTNDPQKGVGFAPKTAVNTSQCEVMRCYRVLRDALEPIQFIVPRKGDQFQSDLYPETYAGTAMMSCAEWLGGGSAEPAMGDIRELAAQSVEAAEFVAKKSPAELEKELSDANARIKELEAELAALKG